MRKLVLILVYYSGLQLVAAQQPIVSSMSDTPSSSPTTASDILADVLWRIAITSRVPIGFESVDQPMKSVWSVNSSQAFAGGTLTEALDAAVSVDQGYEWRFVDDTVVVRPKTAWTDAADPLNQQVNSLEVRSWPVVRVLDGLIGLIYNGRFESRASAADSVSLRVDSGTVLQVLNKLTRTAEQVMWVADYRPSSQPALRLTVRGPRIVKAWAGSRHETRR